MASSILFEEQVEIPVVGSLAEFRGWAASADYPERGRFDYLGGRIEVDMSPEDLYCHNAVKNEFIYTIQGFLKLSDFGELFSDRVRVSCPEADLSAEPDSVFVTHESFADDRIRRVPSAAARPGRFIELEGPPDMVLEIVSDSSVAKDTRRLPVRYWQAGVLEYWLADARGPNLVFRIQLRGSERFRPARRDREGFQYSPVFGRRFRLVRRPKEPDRWTYDLQVKEAGRGS